MAQVVGRGAAVCSSTSSIGDKPLRCHPMTVSGLTTTRTPFHLAQILDNTTQKARSASDS